MQNQVTVQHMIRVEGESSIKACCDIEIDQQVRLKDVKVVDLKRGLTVLMPRAQGKDGLWYDLVQILTSALQAAITQAVLAAYEQARIRAKHRIESKT